MVENRRTQEEARRHPGRYQPNFKRRDRMCDWISFPVLLMSFLDYLAMHGWKLQRTRARREGGYADIAESTRSLEELCCAWGELAGYSPITLKEGLLERYFQPWLDWLPYMPPEVQAAWEKRVVAARERAELESDLARWQDDGGR